MMKLWRLILLLLYGVMAMASTYALGNSHHYKHLNSASGLPHQQVEALAQDQKGYVWIGSRNGLARYDGYEMTCYYHDDSRPESLANSFVKCLFVDSRNRVWVCTTGGVSRYRPATDDFANYIEGTEYMVSMVETSDGRILCAGNGLHLYDEQADIFQLVHTPEMWGIKSLAIDNDDNLYMSCDYALFRCDRTLKHQEKLPVDYFGDFLNGTVTEVPMMIDHEGRLWVGRNGDGISSIDLNAKEVKKYSAEEIGGGLVRIIHERPDHSMVLGTERGLVVIGTDGHVDITRHSLLQPNALSDNAIYALLTDREGNQWVGSYFGGVDILLESASAFHWMEPGYEPGQINARVLRAMAEVDGRLWVATEDNGLFVVDRKSGIGSRFSHIPELGTNVHSLYYDHKTHDLWIGTFLQGLFRYNIATGASRCYQRSHGLVSDAIFFITRGLDGRIWFATTQGLRYYDSQIDEFVGIGHQVLDNTFVYTLCVDHAGNLWAGTVNDGLFQISAADGHVTQWAKGESGLRDNYITCLYENSLGRICIGTNLSGLQYIDPAKPDSVQRFDAELHLSNYTVCAINEDVAHRLWVSTNQGLVCLDPSSGQTILYTTDNGLPTNHFNFASTWKDIDGSLYFGTVQGLVSFHPDALRVAAHADTVRWKRLTIGNQVQTASAENSPIWAELDAMSTITLSYDQARQFTVDYGVVKPADAGTINYQAKLEGRDAEWRDMGHGHVFDGYHLSPGSYRLLVRANSSNKAWDDNPVRQLAIVVRPPFWRTWWAYLSYIALALLAIGLIGRQFRIRRQSREAIRRAEMENEKLRAIDQAKFEFFTTVSHELKTPLSLIVAPLRNIQRRENLSPDGQRNLNIALKHTDAIGRLVGELVTYNKVETDAFRLYVQQGNPMDFLRRAMPPFREAASQKSISLKMMLEDNGELVWFSPQYVDHIVSNLLSNALKFTPDGGTVTVRADIRRGETDGLDYLKIEVADTGIGIMADELPHIFDRYYQTRRGFNVASGGWGIGLALVKRLAELHKGRVSVSSVVGQGSTFEVALCVSQQAFDEQNRIAGDKVLIPVGDYKHRDSIPNLMNDEMPAKAGKEDNSDGEGLPVVLVVEDNAEMRRFLQTELEAHYRVLTARNGQEAIASARREMVHLVVSDVMMPDMDGYKLCQWLKGNLDTSHIPIILLTAKTESDDVATGFRAGANAYVTKPFDIDILVMQIDNILKLLHSQQKENVEMPTDDLSSAMLSSIDRDFLRRMKQLVEENLGNSDFSIQEITSSLGVSRSLLHVKMKSLMNMSMGDYIRHQRLEHACEMLDQGYNVSETAYTVGFADPNHFSRTFKKYIGMNPSEYLSRKEKK
jgi:signal transduction histidine kinase/ligand-binding sensor domain-containing protein/DNA-binding response OmpR family regulator